MTAKEYWDKAEQLRKRIKRKKHEICILRQRAEGIGDSGMNDMPKTASPEPNKMENIICEILALEQEVKVIQQEYDILIADNVFHYFDSSYNVSSPQCHTSKCDQD